MKIYEYKNCSTCKKALKFLDARGVDYQSVPIVEKPPSLTELKKMLKVLKSRGDSIKKLFNTSGVVYREMKLGAKLDRMEEKEALALLAANGKLVKRPFLLGQDDGLVGFKEVEWKRFFS